MEQHAVPRNISSFQFHLIGDMTLRQFGYLAAGAIMAFIVYKASPLPALFTMSIAGMFGLVGFAFAFVPIQERPLDMWMAAFIKSILSPTQYVWHKVPLLPDVLTRPIVVHIQKTQPQKDAHIDARNKLDTYLQTLPSTPHQTLNLREKKYIDNTLTLFGKAPAPSAGIAPLSGAPSASPTPVTPPNPVPQTPVIPTPPVPPPIQSGPTPVVATTPLSHAPIATAPVSQPPIHPTAPFPTTPAVAPAPSAPVTPVTTVPHPTPIMPTPIQSGPTPVIPAQPIPAPALSAGIAPLSGAPPKPPITPTPIIPFTAPVTPPVSPIPPPPTVIQTPVVPAPALSAGIAPLSGAPLPPVPPATPVASVPHPAPALSGTPTVPVQHLPAAQPAPAPALSEGIAPPVMQPATPPTINAAPVVTPVPTAVAPVPSAGSGAPPSQEMDDMKRQLAQLMEEKKKLSQELTSMKQVPAPTPQEGPQVVKPTVAKDEPQKPTIKAVTPKQAIDEIGLPSLPQTPNVVIGVIKDGQKKQLPNIILTIKDSKGMPIRALKTNKLGQFITATPLANGTYYLEVEDPMKRYVFDVAEITMKGEIFLPIEITAKGEKDLIREKLTKELFGNK